MPQQYEQDQITTRDRQESPEMLAAAPDDTAMQDAAEALRQTEVEAVLPDVHSLDPAQLDQMSIDELRAVANALDVPNRAQITEQDELIAAIRCRL
jgi:hypothetical protein